MSVYYHELHNSEINTFYIRDLVSFIRQVDRKPLSIERKFTEIDFYIIDLPTENPFTRAAAHEILYNYTNFLLKLKV